MQNIHIKEINAYKKAGLQKELDANIMQALDLNAGESILITLIISVENVWPFPLFGGVRNYLIITADRIIILKGCYSIKSGKLKKDVDVNAIIPIKEIDNIDVTMKHYPRKKERLLYIASTKIPTLTIKTGNNYHEIYLKGVMFYQKKIAHIIECMSKINNGIVTNENYDRGDLHSASMEMLMDILYPGVQKDSPDGIKKRKKIMVYVLLVIVLGGITIWVAAVYLTNLLANIH